MLLHCIQAVLCRLQISRLDVSINADMLFDALHDYFIRSAKEAHSRGTYLDLDSDNPEGTLPEGYQPLEVQLEALESFHTWWTAALRGFKVVFWSISAMHLLLLQNKICNSRRRDQASLGADCLYLAPILGQDQLLRTIIVILCL